MPLVLSVLVLNGRRVFQIQETRRPSGANEEHPGADGDHASPRNELCLVRRARGVPRSAARRARAHSAGHTMHTTQALPQDISRTHSG